MNQRKEIGTMTIARDYWKLVGDLSYSDVQDAIVVAGNVKGLDVRSIDEGAVAYTCVVAGTPIVGDVYLPIRIIAMICNRSEDVTREHLSIGETCGFLVRVESGDFNVIDDAALLVGDNRDEAQNQRMFTLLENLREVLDFDYGENFPLVAVASARNWAKSLVALGDDEDSAADHLLLKILDDVLLALLAHAQWVGHHYCD